VARVAGIQRPGDDQPRRRAAGDAGAGEHGARDAGHVGGVLRHVGLLSGQRSGPDLDIGSAH
jgi:hypothetical protein